MVYISGLLERAKAQAKSPQGGKTHTVKSGETLSGIGAKYGIDWHSITGFRSGDPNLIYPGEVLNLGGGTSATAPTSAPSTTGQQQPKPAGNINSFLEKYQDEIMSSVQQKPEVRRLTTEEFKKELAPSVSLPEPINYANLFKGFRDEYNVEELETGLNEIKAQEDELYAAFRQQRTTERGKPVAMGVIEGRIGEEERAYLERADYLGRQRSRISNELTTKYSLIGQIMDFERMTYTDATSRYQTEFDRNLSVYGLIRQQERDELSDYDRAVDSAKSNLQLYVNAFTQGNMSWADLDDNQKVLVSKLEVQSGLPIGSVANIRMSTADRILNINEKTGEALMIGENGQFEIKQTGMRPTPTAPSTVSDTKANRQLFEQAATTASGYTFPDLIEKFATTMSLEEIYTAYANSEMGKEYGNPIENRTIIRILYETAKGEKTEDEGYNELVELGLIPEG